MSTPQPASWTADPRARRVQARISTLFILIGLVAAAGARYAYQHGIQAPACYDYARGKNLPELEQLRFAGAKIATKQRVHVCYFEHRTSGDPVTLRFDRADIPNLRDGAEIATIIAAFVLSVILGRWRWRRWLVRNGYT